jgi:trans-2,3-dihydro-3-hydroxyanthranilate isomerase
MPRHRYVTADVFTDAPFGGNQLAVFPDARGIPEHRLLDITREFNYSETTFVYPAEEQGHTRRVRIFTPGGEIPFAGHPTVGTAHVLAAIGEIPLTGDTTPIVLGEGVGPVPVEIRAKNGVPVFAQLTVAKLPEKGPTSPDRALLARVLCLNESDLMGAHWEPQGWSCGLPFLYVPLMSRDAVSRAKLRIDEWELHVKGTWAQDIFLFAMQGEREGSDIHARMFGPGVNVAEDPATGSACAGLAGYLAARETRSGSLKWRVEQGFEMGRPSILELEAEVADGTCSAVRVGGSTVLVAEGTIEVPS